MALTHTHSHMHAPRRLVHRWLNSFGHFSVGVVIVRELCVCCFYLHLLLRQQQWLLFIRIIQLNAGLVAIDVFAHSAFASISISIIPMCIH